MKTIKIDALWDFTNKALIHTGVSTEDAKTIADTLVTTDTFGVLSHGTKNLYQYIQKCQAGGLDPKAVPEVEKEGLGWAVINGNCAFGMVSACKGMELAMEKARKCGIGYVGVHNSCHFGAAGYYANLAAQNGMIGLAMSNTDPNMAVPNSSGVAIGNNPFSFAVPYREYQTIFLDMALSNVAALKVIMAKESGKSVPSGWLVDKEGQPTNDPSGFPYESFLLPVGAHKGYGLAMLVEMLASVLTGAGIASEVPSWNLDMKTKNNTGNAFIAIDIAQIMPRELFEARVNQLVEDLKSRPKAKGADQIYLPGEIEWNKRQSALDAGTLALTDAMVENLSALSEMTGIQIDW